MNAAPALIKKIHASRAEKSEVDNPKVIQIVKQER